MGVIFDKM